MNIKAHGNSTEQKINALSNTHTKSMKENCMEDTLYMIMTSCIHLGSEKEVTGMCSRRRIKPLLLEWGE